MHRLILCGGWAVLVCVIALGSMQTAEPPAYRVAGPLSEPVVFGEGVVCTGEFESHPAFTPDGRTLYFVRSTPAFSDWKIYVTRYSEGWGGSSQGGRGATKTEPIPPLSGCTAQYLCYTLIHSLAGELLLARCLSSMSIDIGFAARSGSAHAD